MRLGNNEVIKEARASIVPTKNCTDDFTRRYSRDGAGLGSTVAVAYGWLTIGGLVGLLLYWLLIRAFCRLGHSADNHVPKQRASAN